MSCEGLQILILNSQARQLLGSRNWTSGSPSHAVSSRRAARQAGPVLLNLRNPNYTTMTSPSPSTYEAVVIGAGIMGSCTAYNLSKIHGPGKVLLLEQFDFLHRRGSSHGDSRIIRRTYPQDHFTQLMFDAYHLWDQAQTEAGTSVFVKTGGLDFAAKDHQGIQNLISAAEKWQVPHQVMTPAEAKKRFPAFNLPEDYVAVYCPDSGVLKASKAVGMFQSLARNLGCHLKESVKVLEIQKKDGQDFQIKTDQLGVITTKKCIITAGAWTQKLVDSVHLNGKRLQLALPLRPIQTTVAYWKVNKAEAFSGADGTFPVFISYGHGFIYGCPGLEFPGLIKVSLHHGPDCDPDNRTFLAPTTEIEAEIKPFLRDYFVGVESKAPVRTESCMYTVTPREDYILEAGIGGVEGLVIGCGFSGHGFKLGPVVGKILAGLATNGEFPYEGLQKYFTLENSMDFV